VPVFTGPILTAKSFKVLLKVFKRLHTSLIFDNIAWLDATATSITSKEKSSMLFSWSNEDTFSGEISAEASYSRTVRKIPSRLVKKSARKHHPLFLLFICINTSVLFLHTSNYLILRFLKNSVTKLLFK